MSNTEVVKCPECLKGVPLNPEKHKNREKQCPFCRTVIAKPKLSLAQLLKSPFQALKKVRKVKTRERFISRMRFYGLSDKEIDRRLEKRFGDED